ncbi:MAG: hypothetical protein BRC57_00235 [Cyanobacteria bacterium QS_8_48_54]|nr:MAG: hypothetical protein BRC57_00235 [Cyanobacteria bacterium QS_8_48_54]
MQILFILLAAVLIICTVIFALQNLLPAVTKNSKKSSQHRQRIRELENTLEEKDQTINNQNERVRYLENHLPGGQGSSESGQSS